MAIGKQIRNPVEWGWSQIGQANRAFGRAGRSLGGTEETRYSQPPAVRRIGLADLREALARGFEDFGAARTDIVVICLVYPVIGLGLAWLLIGTDMLHLLAPLIAGFALIGPAAAIGLYEMSRRREAGQPVDWADAFAVARAPGFGAILILTLALVGVLAAWMGAAYLIYEVTLGPEPPVSAAVFARETLTTAEGWTMIAAGLAVGLVFAAIVFAASVVSFPLLVDRDVGLITAVLTSVRAVLANPGPMAIWGLIVAGSLFLGAMPFLLGLAVVLPVLGHATWHLYRRLVEH